MNKYKVYLECLRNFEESEKYSKKENGLFSYFYKNLGKTKKSHLISNKVACLSLSLSLS